MVALVKEMGVKILCGLLGGMLMTLIIVLFSTQFTSGRPLHFLRKFNSHNILYYVYNSIIDLRLAFIIQPYGYYQL